MRSRSTNAATSLFVILAALAIGCETKNNVGPFGPAENSPLLAPFAGKWTFDFEKTLAIQKAAGMTDEQIEQARQIFADSPDLGKMHPDLKIHGNVAVGAGTPTMEYRFFSMHDHSGKVCGKAWHHEDRDDPGDMSKCYVRLSIVNGELHMDVNMLDDLDLDDPDLQSLPGGEGDASKCDVDKQDADNWMT
jgi:hypothetical protein